MVIRCAPAAVTARPKRQRARQPPIQSWDRAACGLRLRSVRPLQSLDARLLVPSLHRPFGVADGAAPFEQDLATFDGLLQFDRVSRPAPDARGRHAEGDFCIRHREGS